MTRVRKHNRWVRLIVLLVPVFLAFWGMKVPDLSGPQKPKPLRRAVLAKTPVQSAKLCTLKIAVEPLLSSTHSFTIPLVESKLTVQSPLSLTIPAPTPPLLLSRAPPESVSHV